MSKASHSIVESPDEEIPWEIEKTGDIDAGYFPALTDLTLQSLDQFLETALTQILFAIVKLPQNSPVRPHLVKCSQCLYQALRACEYLLHNAGG